MSPSHISELSLIAGLGLALALALPACGDCGSEPPSRPSPQTNNATTGATAAQETDGATSGGAAGADSTGGETAGPGADRDGSDLPPPSPEVARMNDLITGKRSLVDLVDPEVGLLEAQVFSTPNEEEKRADKDGIVRVARRLCGAAARERLEDLSNSLRQRLEWEREDGNELFTCTAEACTYEAAGEWDLGGRFEFQATPSGPRLRRMTFIEGGPVSEEFVEQAGGWASRELKALEGGGCTEGSKKLNVGYWMVCNTGRDVRPGLPMRSEPTWKESDEVVTLLDGAPLPDGAIVEDRAGREGEWWQITFRQKVGGGVQYVDGWVVSRNGDKTSPDKGKPTLCPVPAR